MQQTQLVKDSLIAIQDSITNTIAAGKEIIEKAKRYHEIIQNQALLEEQILADSVLKPVGQGLELVALSHPNELFAKEISTFNVLFDGKPLANAVVTIAAGGVRYRGVLNEITATTNAQGEFNVTWPFAEMYWLKLSYPSAPTMKIEGAPVEMPEKRYSYAATLEVLPQ